MEADLLLGKKVVLEFDPVTNGYKLAVNSPYVDTFTALTGQITGTVAGTPQRGPSIAGTNGFYLTAHPDNTDTVWVMHTGTTKTQAYPLYSNFQMIFAVSNLSQLKFDVDVSGEKICWAKA